MKQPPPRLPDLSEFLSSSSPEVPDGIARRVSETFGGQVALLLLDLDALYLHPTAIHPKLAGEREAEERELFGVSVPLMQPGEHTLSRAIFNRKTLRFHREEWKGATPPVAGEHLNVTPVHMADEIVGVLLVGSEEPFAGETIVALEYVAAQAGAALGIAERYSDSVWRARRRIEPSLAAQVQHDLLPPQEQYTERLSMAGRIEPAYEIGGDWYDYAITDTGMFVAVADVSGKGLIAEHLASTTFGAIRKARREREGLPEIAAAANRALETISSPGYFATMILAQIDTETREVELLNAGHPAPIIFYAEPSAEPSAKATAPPAPLPLSSRNPPAGALRGKERPEFASETHRLEPGSRLLFYSDGLIERRDDSGEPLGEEGLLSYVEDARTLAPFPFIHDLLQRVTSRQEGSLDDDATAVIVDL